MLVALILSALPLGQSALAAAPLGVDGRILTSDQTGDKVNWVEIARSGNYSLIVRSSYLNVNAAIGHYNDPDWQHIIWNDNDVSTNYPGSLVYQRINAWFNSTAVAAGDNLPSGARLRNFTMENTARSNLGTASTSAGLSNGFSSPTTKQRGIGNDIAFALSFSEAANFISKFNFIGDRNPTTQESNAIAKANCEKIKIPDPTNMGGQNARGAWLRSSGDVSGTIGSLSVENDYKGIAFHMYEDLNERNEYGYLYPALWVDQAIFEPVAPTQYTLSYSANGGQGTPAKQTVSVSNVTISNTKPTRSGFTFVGWSENIAATSAQYEAGGSITLSGDVTLYAVWSQITYTITFDANGGTGALAPQIVAPGVATLRATIPTRTNYAFLGWALNKAATDKQYIAGGTINNVNNNITLYAVWTQSTYAITYDANEGYGAPAQQTVNIGGATLSVKIPTLTGSTFLGWAENKTDTTAKYSAGDKMFINSNVTLYAVWSQRDTVTITYNANEGSGAPPAQTVLKGDDVKLSAVIPTLPSKVFVGWNVNPSELLIQYECGGVYQFANNIILYAVWVDTTTHILIYDANGGSYAPPQRRETGVITYKLDAYPAVRAGFTFLGWAKTATATKPFDNGYGTWNFPPGIGPNDWEFTTRTGIGGSMFVTTIYAVWSKADIVVLHKDMDTGETLREDRYEIPAGKYGPYVPVSFDGYDTGTLESGSAKASGTINRFATKTITYLYPRLLIDEANHEAVLTKTGANQTSTDGKIHVGDTIRYTIVAENKGHPITVWANATLSDELCYGVTFVNNVTLNGTLAKDTEYTFENGTLTVPLGDIKGGEKMIVTFEVEVTSDAYGRDIRNIATVTGENGEVGEVFDIIGGEDTGESYIVIEQSKDPKIDEITEGDDTITGTGEPGATIAVKFPNGIKPETMVARNGIWIIDVLSDVPPLSVGDVVTAIQTEVGKDLSDQISASVQGQEVTPSEPPPAPPPAKPPARPPARPPAKPPAKPPARPPVAPPVAPPTEPPEEPPVVEPPIAPPVAPPAAFSPPLRPIRPEIPFYIHDGPEIRDGAPLLLLRFLDMDEHRVYLKGYQDSTIRPNNGITRAEVATIFYRLLKDSFQLDNPSAFFIDVPDDAWYSKAVKTLADLGILKGYADGSFRPNNPVTRAEYATIAARFDVLETVSFASFIDVPMNHWAAPFIYSVHAKGWANGYQDSSFRPSQLITRAEVTKIVNTMLSRLPEASPNNLVNPYSDITSSHWAYISIMEASAEHGYARDDENIEAWHSHVCPVIGNTLVHFLVNADDDVDD